MTLRRDWMYSILINMGYSPDEAIFYLENHSDKIGDGVREFIGKILKGDSDEG